MISCIYLHTLTNPYHFLQIIQLYKHDTYGGGASRHTSCVRLRLCVLFNDHDPCTLQ